MRRKGMRMPYVSLSLFRPLAANLTKPYNLITTSLLGKYAAYFFLPKQMYFLAVKKRHSSIPDGMEGQLIRIFRGRLWKGMMLNEFQAGYKIGSIVRSRTLAVFRQKAARKKKPTIKAATSSMLTEAKIYKIRQIKAGLRRKSVGQYNPQFEAQFQSV